MNAEPVNVNSGWRELGSGSDAALLVWAPSFEALLLGGARALLEFSAVLENPDERVSPGPMVDLCSPDQIELLLDWLNEVNFRSQVDQWLCWAPKFVLVSPTSIRCRLNGFFFDPARDRMEKEIKAATRHCPFLGQGNDGTWVTKVTLDL